MVATTWLWLAIGAGVIAVLYGVFSMMAILKLPAGNARERQQAEGEQEKVPRLGLPASHEAQIVNQNHESERLVS
jgi:hypothetical protein